MSKAGEMMGRAFRTTAKAFAALVGATVGEVRKYMAATKTYNDAARKWGERHGVDTSGQWRPWSITAMSRSQDPVESFRRAQNNLYQRLDEGVSNTLNQKAGEYAENLAKRMAQSTEFLLDDRMQRIVSDIQTGALTPSQVLQSTGGQSLTALYTKKGDHGSVEIDFSGVLDMIWEDWYAE